MQPVVRPAPILGHFLACSSFFGGLRSFGFRVQGLASFLLVAFDIAVVASRLKLVRLTATRETKRERERASELELTMETWPKHTEVQPCNQQGRPSQNQTSKPT